MLRIYVNVVEKFYSCIVLKEKRKINEEKMGRRLGLRMHWNQSRVYI